MAINKSAARVGTLVFDNGNRNTIYLGTNRNTGSDIVWQHVAGRRAKKMTGRNIPLLFAEIREIVGTGEGHWEGDVNTALLAKFTIA